MKVGIHAEPARLTLSSSDIGKSYSIGGSSPHTHTKTSATNSCLLCKMWRLSFYSTIFWLDKHKFDIIRSGHSALNNSLHLLLNRTHCWFIGITNDFPLDLLNACICKCISTNVRHSNRFSEIRMSWRDVSVRWMCHFELANAKFNWAKHCHVNPYTFMMTRVSNTHSHTSNIHLN